MPHCHHLPADEFEACQQAEGPIRQMLRCAAHGAERARTGALRLPLSRGRLRAIWRRARPPRISDRSRGLLRQLDDALLRAGAEAVAIGVVAGNVVVHADIVVFDQHAMGADALAAERLCLYCQFDLLAHDSLRVDRRCGIAVSMERLYDMMSH